MPFQEDSMPMYAYACKDCSHAFDIQQSFSDDSLTVCPECSGSLRKKFNSVGVVFKGSGFYRTDSREAKPSGGARKAAGSEPAAAAGAGSGGSGESSSGATSGASAPGSKAGGTSSTTSPSPAKSAAGAA
jgi:putative FmdB family regulatory protein